MKKLQVSQAVLVEGKYDQIRLNSFLEGLILPVHGFSIFTDLPLQELIRKLAEKQGVLILMDSDAAGFKIRGFLAGILPKKQVTHLYIPDLKGKESRKSAPSKEGTLGVEGMSTEVLEEAFKKAGIISNKKEITKAITTKDLYYLGLSGGVGSSEKRKCIYRHLGLPEKLSTTRALKVLNQICGLEQLVELVELVETLGEDNG